MIAVVVVVDNINITIYMAAAICFALSALYLAKWTTRGLLIYIATAVVVLFVAHTLVKVTTYRDMWSTPVPYNVSPPLPPSYLTPPAESCDADSGQTTTI